jgi:hypothetical protein
LFSDIHDSYIVTIMIDVVIKKYRKKGAQLVQDFCSEMYAKQRDGETCVDGVRLATNKKECTRTSQCMTNY